MADVRRRLEGTGWDTCVVLNEERVLLGRLQRSDFATADPDSLADEAMHPGPLTFRPDHAGRALLEEMRERGLRTAPITTSDGVFVGIVLRDGIERALARSAEDDAARSLR